MHFRTATINDHHAIKALYQKVAQVEGGIARLEHEITDDYISNFLTKSLASGLIIVAEKDGDESQLIGEVHAYKSGLRVFDHVLGDLTIVVHPDYHGKKIGRTLFTIFLEEVGRNRPDIGKVELITRESNQKAIDLYHSLGFSVEGRFEMRIKTTAGSYEADIPMGWQNPNYEF